MTYNEWLDLIELVKKSNRNKLYLEKMQNAPYNENINETLKPKLVDLVTYKFTKAIKRVVDNIVETFKNPNSLEFSITNFEKEIQYALSICNLPQLDANTRNELVTAINEEKNNVYDILIKKSLEVDRTGMYKIIIEKKKNGKR